MTLCPSCGHPNPSPTSTACPRCGRPAGTLETTKAVAARLDELRALNGEPAQVSTRPDTTAPLGIVTAVVLVSVLLGLAAAPAASSLWPGSATTVGTTTLTPIETPEWLFDMASCDYTHNLCTTYSAQLSENTTHELLVVECMSSAPDFAGCSMKIYRKAAGGWAPMPFGPEVRIEALVNAEVEWLEPEVLSSAPLAHGYRPFCAVANVDGAKNKRCFAWSGAAWRMTHQFPATTPITPPGPVDLPSCMACCTNFTGEGISTACSARWSPLVNPIRCEVENYTFEAAGLHDQFKIAARCNLAMLREKCVAWCTKGR